VTRTLQVTRLEDRCTPATAYLATDLIADTPGIAPFTDPTLVNAWGISPNPNGPIWVSANGSDLSEVYVPGSPFSSAFRVTIPGGSPTGQLFNTTGSTTDFIVTDGTHSTPAAFIFASEAGTVTGWAPTVGGGTTTRPAEPGFTATDGAVYKGIALGKNGTQNLLYVADFHGGKIDVLNGQWKKVTLGTGGFGTFSDPNLPAGYAPFNVANIGGKLYVSYAKQNAMLHDDVAGPGHGFIDVFDLTGHFQQRLVSRGKLNSPWGMALAPAGFGDFAGDLLVGNFGDGRIHAYNPTTGKFLGTLSESPGHPITIDGLWGLEFGVTAADSKTLYYAAGPDHENHGLFGEITANPAGTNPVSATLNKGTLVITGSRDNDHVTVGLNDQGTQIVVRAGNGAGDDQGEDEGGKSGGNDQGEDEGGENGGGSVIGQFAVSAVNLITFNGLAGNDTFVVNPNVMTPVIADGGAGNDLIKLGGGPGIAIGGPGNDTLIAGKGRDILIGGTGSDHLVGGPGEDILIGGTTAYDSNQAALIQLMTAWNGPGTFDARVAVIRNGTGGVPKLDATTVFDDMARDDLVGGPGPDWFFQSPLDVIHNKKPGDIVN
jgi:uncharacterized protein (TIGR03118 family)